MELKSSLLEWSSHLPKTIRGLLTGVLEQGTDTDASLRAAVVAHAAALGDAKSPWAPVLPAELLPWLTKVSSAPSGTLDREVDALRQAGYSDGAIFEVTVAAALGAGLARCKRGVEALEEATR
jgi:alkylhydroperoxidase family enzyme